MSNLKDKTLGLLGFLLAMSLSTFSAQAQEDVVEEAQVQVQEADDNTEEVVVTGSRLSKSTYTSISPLQVITTEATREVGLIDPADILLESPASSGQQVDLTFGGFVLDNGPGSTNANLRGLGSARSLVLINGRRVAPAGAEGAPTSPDLNLLPGSLVSQYDILLDGASSVYGSDAVAGVVNAILRKDFDGFEFDLFSDFSSRSGGEGYTANAAWGKNFDRGFIGFGAEYSRSKALSTADRPWTSKCDRNVEIDQAGNIRYADQFYSTVLLQKQSDCKPSGLVGRFFVPNRYGSIYYTAGSNNTGIPNFTEAVLFDVPVDLDNDGFADVSYSDYSTDGERANFDILPEFERTAFMSYGEYTFEGNSNLTPYYEFMYSQRETDRFAGQPQLFPTVPGSNPYNPCNPNGVDGVDCGLAEAAILENPDYLEDFTNYYVTNFNCFGLPASLCVPSTFGIFASASGPLPVDPIVGVLGDRSREISDVEQTRTVLGLRGDLPAIRLGGNQDWSFDLYTVFSESDGTASRVGIRDDRLQYSLTTSRIENGEVVCGTATGGACVPVNLFAPSLYGEISGNFATQAERDFLFDTRDFRTKYKQIIGSGYLSGSIFELQGGSAKLGAGLEYRHDSIDSIPDDVASQGLFFGYFTDQGAFGENDTKELFAEIDLPLIAGKELAKELTLNFSGRYTDDEYYGDDTTYSGKIGYRPVDSLLIRATYGTSFRAPNLRENFLGGQSGFANVVDPCVPTGDGVYNEVTDEYVAANDNREQQVIDNCLSISGISPEFFAGENAVRSLEIERAGALVPGSTYATLVPETSTSKSIGISYEQPFFDAFDLSLGVTYYELDIENTILGPSGSFAVGSCYTAIGFRSSFCDDITRNTDPTSPDFNELEFVELGFLNRDKEFVEGLDVNSRFDMPITMFDRAIDFSANLNLNRTIKAGLSDLSDDDNPSIERFDGEFGYPDWRGQMQLRGEYNKYSVTWGMNYIGAVEQDSDEIDEFDDINGIADTCLGPDAGDLLCRDVGFAPSHVTHSLSMFYNGDRWKVGAGVRNLFDKAPPVVDSSEVLSINNAPIGYGYDFLGRNFFVRLGYDF